jgi:hypothetical protein
MAPSVLQYFWIAYALAFIVNAAIERIVRR